ncbi:MAG TPA: hypothetical protein VFG11_05860 [Acidobacteriota bacterium]|nr:hypothetical protein [Acidobacteriota bacterium]
MVKRLALILPLLLAGSLLFAGSGATSENSTEKTYRPKSQIFSIKSEILGGEFRISNVIPLHGDFSDYRKIEVTGLKSLIGDAIPEKVLAKYNQDVFKEFQLLSKTREITTIADFVPPAPKIPDPVDQPQTQISEDADSLDGPLLTYDDLRRFDELRAQKEAKGAYRTLVIVGEVLDYLKGNHVLQFLPFNIGSTIFTIRFRYYDKETGEELGRQIITGEVSADTYAGFMGMHSALAGVVEALADQVTRRAIEADR